MPAQTQVTSAWLQQCLADPDDAVPRQSGCLPQGHDALDI